MEKRQVGKERLVLRCSSTIANWRERFEEKFEAEEWKGSLFDPTVFCGLYWWGDYWKFLIHRGRKAVYWCGTDILNLRETNWFWLWVLPKIKAKHLCENQVEYDELLKYGIHATIHPFLFSKYDDWKVTFKPSKNPQVYVSCHQDREDEYGVGILSQVVKEVPEITFHVYGNNEVPECNHANIICHGPVSNEQFNEEIKDFQCGLRLNEFDGFSELLIKPIMLGQYAISRIKYPHIAYFSNLKELVIELKKLKYHTQPNYKARDYWEKIINIYPDLF